MKGMFILMIICIIIILLAFSYSLIAGWLFVFGLIFGSIIETLERR